MTNELILLAGGKGSRLSSVLPATPKCMAPVNGQPFLAYLLEYYQQQGIERFIFALGHLHEQVESFVHTRYAMLNTVIVTEKEALGTGGAIRLSMNEASGTNVFVTNGDSFTDSSLSALHMLHDSVESECTLAVQEVMDVSRYGAISLNAQHQVTQFAEKAASGPGFINVGLYLLQKESFLRETPTGPFSFEHDWLAPLTKQRRVYASASSGKFIDIGTPQDLAAAATLLNF